MCMEWVRWLPCVVCLCLCPCVRSRCVSKSFSILVRERVSYRSRLSREGGLSIHIYLQLVQPKRANFLLSPLLRCWRQFRCRCVLRIALALDTRIALVVRSRLIRIFRVCLALETRNYSVQLLPCAGNAHLSCDTRT